MRFSLAVLNFSENFEAELFLIYVNMSLESVCIVVQITTVLQPQLVLNLFLISDQFSGSCSYKIVLLEKSVI